MYKQQLPYYGICYKNFFSPCIDTVQPFVSSKTFFYVDTVPVPVPWFVIFELQSSVANPGVKILGLEIFELFDATRCKIHANLYLMAIDFHPCCSAVT
jgi:hypothetical protein